VAAGEDRGEVCGWSVSKGRDAWLVGFTGLRLSSLGNQRGANQQSSRTMTYPGRSETSRFGTADALMAEPNGALTNYSEFCVGFATPVMGFLACRSFTVPLSPFIEADLASLVILP
jgi:hypothetical protein